MNIKEVTLHDIEIDNGQGLQHGHLVAELFINNKGEPEFWSNVSFIPFGNNAEELPEQIIKSNELTKELKEKFFQRMQQ